MTTVEQAAVLEDRTIQPIPASERHGTARDLFTIWFGSNIMLLTVVTGALAATVFGLPFTWAVAALCIGNLVGGVFMALHAAQGPILGVPQMVQTRGQFGSYGALLVVVLVIVMYIGFFASNLVLSGEALAAAWPAVHELQAIALIAVISAAGAILGHDLIHAYARWMSWISGIALLVVFGWIVFIHGLPPLFHTKGAVTAAGLLGAVSVAALWQIAYAPYVSDYSRYLPAATGARTAFWATFWGCALGSAVPMILGALIGACIAGDDVVKGLGQLTGGFAPVALVAFTIAMLPTNAMNLYCGALSTLTIGQTFAPRWSPRAMARTIVVIVLALAALLLSVLGKDSFLVNYTNFILLLLYVLVPWTAINLVDYYLVRHGHYDVASFMRQDGGLYGRVNVAALVCYLFGILIQVPFMSTPLYTGPVATALHGADLSWLIGLALTSPLYFFLARPAAFSQASGRRT
jgi:nucleobase:cation symporter-1, NCS1 family